MLQVPKLPIAEDDAVEVAAAAEETADATAVMAARADVAFDEAVTVTVT